MILKDQIIGWLEERFATEEWSHGYVIDVQISSGHKIEVFVDSDQGLTLRMCTQLSRYLESFLDESADVPDKYKLEVSSPGATRPLVLKRQYHKHVDRTMEVQHGEQTTQGVLKTVDDDQIVLHTVRVERVNKKRKKIEEDVVIPFQEINKAIVKVSI